jgi:hypothetical protein
MRPIPIKIIKTKVNLLYQRSNLTKIQLNLLITLKNRHILQKPAIIKFPQTRHVKSGPLVNLRKELKINPTYFTEV